MIIWPSFCRVKWRARRLSGSWHDWRRSDELHGFETGFTHSKRFLSLPSEEEFASESRNTISCIPSPHLSLKKLTICRLAMPWCVLLTCSVAWRLIWRLNQLQTAWIAVSPLLCSCFRVHPSTIRVVFSATSSSSWSLYRAQQHLRHSWRFFLSPHLCGQMWTLSSSSPFTDLSLSVSRFR